MGGVPTTVDLIFMGMSPKGEVCVCIGVFLCLSAELCSPAWTRVQS